MCCKIEGQPPNTFPEAADTMLAELDEYERNVKELTYRCALLSKGRISFKAKSGPYDGLTGTGRISALVGCILMTRLGYMVSAWRIDDAQTAQKLFVSTRESHRASDQND